MPVDSLFRPADEIKKTTEKSISEEAEVVSGCVRMERIVPECPGCGVRMVFYSSDAFSEQYMCPDCNRFLGVPRRIGFFDKSPFKPRYPPIQH